MTGTGYGKSLIFEGLAVLGGKGKLVIVISPLKALERDQAEQAIAKGIDALVINEDTTKTTGLWKHARTTFFHRPVSLVDARRHHLFGDAANFSKTAHVKGANF